jgi:single-strand DNA-binding protein
MQNDQDITTFGLATNREWITKDGRREQSAEFHDIVCFGKLAEIAGKFLKKGKLVNVEGFLKTRSWDDADGTKKFRTDIVAEDFIMLDRREHTNEVPRSGTRECASSESAQSADLHPEQASEPSITIEDPATI